MASAETGHRLDQGLALSARLRERINALHGVDEPAYLRLLVAGALEPAEYAALLVQYRTIYSALDRAAGAVRDDPVAACFAGLGRGRAAVLDADVHALLGFGAAGDAGDASRAGDASGADGTDSTGGSTGGGASGASDADAAHGAGSASGGCVASGEVVNAATLAYKERILRAATWSGGFVAHHYVRYLADLSGGQLIGQALIREYGSAAAALTFHRLVDPSCLRELKREYRALLDAAPWSAAEQDAIVDEATAAYRCNTAVLVALGGVLARG